MPEPAETLIPPSSAEEVLAEAAPPSSRRVRPAFIRALRSNPRITIAIAMLALGITLVLLGWYGAAYTNIITEQIPYLISGGLLGLGLIIVAGIIAASASGDRETTLLREEIVRLSSALANGSVGGSGARLGSMRYTSNGHQVFSVPGGRSYHEPGCPILEGKEGIKELQPAAAVGAGLAPCKLCASD